VLANIVYCGRNFKATPLNLTTCCLVKRFVTETEGTECMEDTFMILGDRRAVVVQRFQNRAFPEFYF